MIPVIDCHNDILKNGKEIFDAISTVGFVYLKNYGISELQVIYFVTIFLSMWLTCCFMYRCLRHLTLEINFLVWMTMIKTCTQDLKITKQKEIVVMSRRTLKFWTQKVLAKFGKLLTIVLMMFSKYVGKFCPSENSFPATIHKQYESVWRELKPKLILFFLA